MSIRRFISLMLAVLLCLTLAGCGAKEETAGTSGGGEKKAEAPAAIPVAAHVQSAIDASRLLTNVRVAVVPGEGVITCADDYLHNYLPLYSQYDLKGLCASTSGSSMLALTNNNELYYRDIKLADNVADVIYATNTTNEEGWYTTAEGDIYKVYKDFDYDLITSYQIHDGTMPITAIGVEKHDLFVANADGTIACNGNPEHWAKCAEFTNWGKGIAVIAGSKVMNEDDFGVVDYATVAAITADGRTLAVGDFAEDILAMGELSYIAMSDGVIIGVKTDGTLALAGPYTQVLTEAGIAALTNIAAVRVSSEYLSAVDKNGVYYFYDLELYRDYCSRPSIMSVNGAQNDENYAHIYTGGYHYNAGYGMDWVKVPFGENWSDEGDPRPAGSTVALRPASTLQYPLTEEYVEAYLDQLFADRKEDLEKAQYNWFGVYLNEQGYIERLQVTTEGFHTEIDMEFFEYVTETIAGSELFGLSASGLEAMKEFDFTDKYDVFEADGIRIEHCDSPYGEVIDISRQ